MLVPEITLKAIVDQMVIALKDDYEKHLGDESKSILYFLFHDNKVGNYDYYTQAVDLFTNRGPDHNRRIETRLFFDSERAAVPTIHITLPQETNGEDGIGIDEGYEGNEININRTEFQPKYTRRFNALYHIIFTSDNTFEVLLMYHAVKACVISLFDHIQLSGLENLKLSGQDLRIDTSMIPNGVYTRALGVQLSYELTVPRFLPTKMLHQLNFIPNPQNNNGPL